jgi:hypothetical protein
LFESRTFHEKLFEILTVISNGGAPVQLYSGGATLVPLNVLHGSSKITKRLLSNRVGKLVKKQVFKFGDSLFEGIVINDENLEEGFWKF